MWNVTHPVVLNVRLMKENKAMAKSVMSDINPAAGMLLAKGSVSKTLRFGAPHEQRVHLHRMFTVKHGKVER